MPYCDALELPLVMKLFRVETTGFLKKEFKLEDIEKSFLFSSNGMPVVVVDAGKNGDIYIPIHIENSEDLFSILDKYQKSA